MDHHITHPGTGVNKSSNNNGQYRIIAHALEKKKIYKDEKLRFCMMFFFSVSLRTFILAASDGIFYKEPATGGQND